MNCTWNNLGGRWKDMISYALNDGRFLMLTINWKFKVLSCDLFYYELLENKYGNDIQWKIIGYNGDL